MPRNGSTPSFLFLRQITIALPQPLRCSGVSRLFHRTGLDGSESVRIPGPSRSELRGRLDPSLAPPGRMRLGGPRHSASSASGQCRSTPRTRGKANGVQRGCGSRIVDPPRIPPRSSSRCRGRVRSVRCNRGTSMPSARRSGTAPDGPSTRPRPPVRRARRPRRKTGSSRTMVRLDRDISSLNGIVGETWMRHHLGRSSSAGCLLKAATR